MMSHCHSTEMVKGEIDQSALANPLSSREMSKTDNLWMILYFHDIFSTVNPRQFGVGGW